MLTLVAGNPLFKAVWDERIAQNRIPQSALDSISDFGHPCRIHLQARRQQ
jgi:hypothetical protein